MKNFFKIMFVGFALVLGVSLFATNRTKDFGAHDEGLYYNYGGRTQDTIVVSDTLNFIHQINHKYEVSPEIDILWTKVGAGTATLKAEMFESKDGTNYTTVKKGVLQSAYTKTYTISATGVQTLSFKLDTAYFTGRYLKVRYSTTSTASVKGKINHLLKVNIQ